MVMIHLRMRGGALHTRFPIVPRMFQQLVYPICIGMYLELQNGKSRVFFWSFVIYVGWQSFTKCLSQIWLHVRDNIRKNWIPKISWQHARTCYLKYGNSVISSAKYGEFVGLALPFFFSSSGYISLKTKLLGKNLKFYSIEINE